jgi:hypothetical protein
MAKVESRIEVLQKLGNRGGDALIGFGDAVSWGGIPARVPRQGSPGNADWLTPVQT